MPCLAQICPKQSAKPLYLLASMPCILVLTTSTGMVTALARRRATRSRSPSRRRSSRHLRPRRRLGSRLLLFRRLRGRRRGERAGVGADAAQETRVERAGVSFTPRAASRFVFFVIVFHQEPPVAEGRLSARHLAARHGARDASRVREGVFDRDTSRVQTRATTCPLALASWLRNFDIFKHTGCPEKVTLRKRW